MTVAAAVVVVAPAGREGKHGSYVDADEKSHRRETIAVAAAVAEACDRGRRQEHGGTGGSADAHIAGHCFAISWALR